MMSSWVIRLSLLFWAIQVSAGPLRQLTTEANRPYIQADHFSLDLANSYNNESSANSASLLYSINYHQSFLEAVTLSIVIAIDQFYIDYPQGQVQFRGYVASKSQSQFLLGFESDLMNRLKVMGFRYLILADQYSESSSNLAIQRIILQANLNITKANPLTKEIPVPAGSFTTPIILPFLTGVNISSTIPSKLLDFSTQATLTTTRIRFEITCLGDQPTFIGDLEYYVMIYSSDYYNRADFGEFKAGELSGTTGQTPLTYINRGNIDQDNTMIGLSGFSFEGNDYIQFQIGFNNPDEVSASSSNINSILRFNYLIARTNYCSGSTICDQCPYDCYHCDEEGKCLSCPFSSKRELDVKTGRCVPQPGYFESNLTVALPCTAGCSQCSSLNNCTECEEGFGVVKGFCAPLNCPVGTYLNGSSCQDCPFDCETCNSEGECLTCSEQNQHRMIGNESRCVPYVGYYQSNTRVAASCGPGCSRCTSVGVCTQCFQDYFLSGAQCEVYIEEQCDVDGNCQDYLAIKVSVPISVLVLCCIIVYCKMKAS